MAENPDLVIAIAAAVERHDLDELSTYLHDEIEHRDTRLDRVRRGPEAIRTQVARRFLDGRVRTIVVCETREQALRAAGVPD